MAMQHRRPRLAPIPPQRSVSTLRFSENLPSGKEETPLNFVFFKKKSITKNLNAKKIVILQRFRATNSKPRSNKNDKL